MRIKGHIVPPPLLETLMLILLVPSSQNKVRRIRPFRTVKIAGKTTLTFLQYLFCRLSGNKPFHFTDTFIDREQHDRTLMKTLAAQGTGITLKRRKKVFSNRLNSHNSIAIQADRSAVNQGLSYSFGRRVLSRV